MMMAAGRADALRDDAHSSALPSPGPSSPFSPHELHALQQLELRGSLSPQLSPYQHQPQLHQQLHYPQPSIRIHPSDSDQRLSSQPTSQPSFSRSPQQATSQEAPYASWSQLDHQQPQQPQGQQQDQFQQSHDRSSHQQQPQQPLLQQPQPQHRQHQLQAYSSSLATQPSNQWEDSSCWEANSDSNVEFSPVQISAYHLSHPPYQQQQQQQQKRASSASSYASFEAHTPPPPTSSQLVTSVKDFDFEELRYSTAESLSQGLTQEVLRDFEKFCSGPQYLDIQSEVGLTQQPQAAQTQAQTTTRFSRDAQQIWQNQRRLVQQRIMSQDSNGTNGVMAPPTLPRTESTDTDNGFRSSGEAPIPKLDRTMSDVYQDTLYHSSTNEGSLQPSNRLLPQENAHPGSIMQERLQEASVDHLKTRSQSPTGSLVRQRSPFKPHAPESPHREHFASQMVSEPPGGSAARMREWQKVRQDQAAQAKHSSQVKQSLDQVKTVSPKEVALDYKEDPEDEAMGALFPQEPPTKKQKKDQTTTVSRSKPSISRENTRTSETSDLSQPSYGSMATSRRESSQSTNGGNGSGGSNSGNRQVQYPFFQRQARRQASSASININTDSQASDFTPQLTSADSTKSHDFEQAAAASQQRKRSATSSVASPSTPRPRTLSKQESVEEDDEDYTYTCTYHGCTRRFESQNALQRHKREIHHSTAHHSRTSVSGASAASPGAASPVGAQFISANAAQQYQQQQQQPQQQQQAPQQAAQQTVTGHRKSMSADDSDSTTPPGTAGANANSQAGPHICTRINPTTGKPCNSQFSRPYDLTRHEDTIHNSRKEKVKCPLCKDEKTFSRSDALTRHMRVVHGQKEGSSSGGAAGAAAAAAPSGGRGRGR